MVPGDFINENGRVVGNDGRNDGKVYVVKTTKTRFDSGVPADGITTDQRNATEDFIKDNSGNTAAFENNSIAYDNSVEIEGSVNTRQQMVNIINQDNGRGGKADANNRELGGSVSNAGVVTEAPAGDVSNPKDNQRASIEINVNNDTRSTFHSHPSAEIVEGRASGAGTIQRV